MQSKTVAVIGGGFTGLACAYRLAKQGIKVRVYEREDVLGGLARGFKCDGWDWSLERYYHHWFASDDVLLKFCNELGVSDKVIYTKPITVMQTSQGKFAPLDSALALLRYPDLSFLNRIRMGLALAYLKLVRRWKNLEHVTAKQWCERVMGAEGFNAIWWPLLVGKFGRYAATVNMAWLWARIHVRTARLGTFAGGFQEFTNCLATRCRELGVEIKTSCGDLSVSRESSQWVIASADGKIKNGADAVLVAAGPAAFAKVCGSADDVVKHDPRPALGAVVVLLSLKREIKNPAKAYWYSLRKSADKPFLAMIDQSKFSDKKHFANEVLLYFADYLETQSAEWQQSDEMFLTLALQRLKEIDASISESDLNRHWVFREPYAQPIPQIEASQNLPRFEYPHGLFHASLAHVYPWDRGTNFALQLGEQASAAILKCLSR